MEKYIYDNSNGLWYELQGDYSSLVLFCRIPKNALSVSGVESTWITSMNTARYYTSICFSAASYTAILLTLMFRQTPSSPC